MHQKCVGGVSVRVQLELNPLGFVSNPTDKNLRIRVKQLFGGTSKRKVFADTY